MAMKDVCDLKPWAAHGRRLGAGYRPFFGQRREPIERAGHSTDRGVGHTCVARRPIELFVSERTRAIMLAFYVIETESFVGRDPMLAGAARAFVRDTRPSHPP
jgi:hypothetical protein